MVVGHLYRAYGPRRWLLVAEVEATAGHEWTFSYPRTTTTKEDRRVRRPAMTSACPAIHGPSSPHSPSRIYLDRHCKLITAIQTLILKERSGIVMSLVNS